MARLSGRVCPTDALATFELVFPTPDRRAHVRKLYDILRKRDDNIQAIPVLVPASPLYLLAAPGFGIATPPQLRATDLLSFYGAVLHGAADAAAANLPPPRGGALVGHDSDSSGSGTDGGADDSGSEAHLVRGGYIARYVHRISELGSEFTRALISPESPQFALLMTMVREEIQACPRQDVQHAERFGVTTGGEVQTGTTERFPVRLGMIRQRGSSDDEEDELADEDTKRDEDACVDAPPTDRTTGEHGHEIRRPSGALSYAERARERLMCDIVVASRQATERIIARLEQDVWGALRALSRRMRDTPLLPCQLPSEWGYRPTPSVSAAGEVPLDLLAALHESFEYLMASRAYHYPMHFGVYHAARTKAQLFHTAPHRSGLPGDEIIAFAMSVVRCAAREDGAFSEHNAPADALSELCLNTHTRYS